MSSIRRALGQTEPHVSLKTAWKRVIQLSRRLRKQGHTTLLHDRSAVERLLSLDTVPAMDLMALKLNLQGLVQATEQDAEERHGLAVEAWAQCFTITPASGDVEVHIHQPNGAVTQVQVDRWLGTLEGRITLDADHAASWVHHLGGLRIGGSAMVVDVGLAPGQALPAVGRGRRGRERTRESQAWLPHLDTVGNFSATPHCIAERHGALLAEPQRMVIDPFCGAGADAIAAAQAGAIVMAGDEDPGRLAMARQNASHFGVQDRMEFQCGDAIQLLREGIDSHAGATVFLDPPWGGIHWDRDGMNFDTLFGGWPSLIPLMSLAGRIVLKLPRTFDLYTLDPFGRSWCIELGLGPVTDDHADRPRCLTAISDRPCSQEN